MPLTAEELAACGPRCRDCGIEYLLDLNTCAHCGQLVIRRDLVPDSHTPGCPSAHGPCTSCGGVEGHKGDCQCRIDAPGAARGGARGRG